jgi:large subunit ribosomal protein L21
MYSVIETGSKQYLVKPGDTKKINKVDGNVGDEIIFDKILLTATEEGDDVKIGTPYVEGESVKAEILEQSRDRKVRVVKYKRKIRYKKVQGHRQHFTKIKIK